MKNQIEVSTAMLNQKHILLKLGQTVTISAGGNYWQRATVDKIFDNGDVSFLAVDCVASFLFKKTFKKSSNVMYIPITSTLEGYKIVDYKGHVRPQP